MGRFSKDASLVRLFKRELGIEVTEEQCTTFLQQLNEETGVEPRDWTIDDIKTFLRLEGSDGDPLRPLVDWCPGEQIESPCPIPRWVLDRAAVKTIIEHAHTYFDANPGYGLRPKRFVLSRRERR